MSFRAVEQAYEVHGSVPKALYTSAGPVVWGTKVARQIGCGDSLKIIDQCRSEIDRAAGVWAPSRLHDIISAILSSGVAGTLSPPDVSEHYALQDLLRLGRIPLGIPSSVLIPLDVALRNVADLGYRVPVGLIKHAEQLEGESSAFEAAHHLMTRRFCPLVFCFAPRFVVPDPFESIKTARIFDQLWIVRDDVGSRHVRLLALNIDRTNSLRDSDNALRFSAMGYELYHAMEPWARVDPQRVIFEFLQLAGIPPIMSFQRPAPGPTISDYKCEYCKGPMIRTPSGYGIVDHRDRFVHEECFNVAVNVGFFDQHE